MEYVVPLKKHVISDTNTYRAALKALRDAKMVFAEPNAPISMVAPKISL
jgi:hypothetical protein